MPHASLGTKPPFLRSLRSWGGTGEVANVCVSIYISIYIYIYIGAPLPSCPCHQLPVGSRCLAQPLFALSVLSGVLWSLLGQVAGRLGRVPCSSDCSAWWPLRMSLPTPARTEWDNLVSVFRAPLGLVESCNKPVTGFGLGSSRCSGAPRCRPVSSARSRAALLTPLSPFSLSLCSLY